MAPVEINTTHSLVPASVLGTHILLVAVVTAVVGKTIYRSYLALPPSSSTRHRRPLRRHHAQTFSLLAVVSLAVAAYHGVQLCSLSYRTWASERGYELPDSLLGDKGGFRGGEHPGRVHLTRWLSDTKFYQNALEAVAENATYFWWGQQFNVGLVSWSAFLAFEGRRRNVSNLWTFIVLAQLVNLSFAQNIFFVALLLTPVPLPDNLDSVSPGSRPGASSRLWRFKEIILPAKDVGFLPHPSIYLAALLATFGTIFLLPYASNTPSFMTVTFLFRVLPFSLLALPHIIPTKWGTHHTHPHSAHATYTTVFRTVSTISALLQLKATLLAIFSAIPETNYYRPSVLHPFRMEHRSVANRSYTAFSSLFGAIKEHPAVSGVAWDVILTGLSLGVWAAVRGLDPWEMIRSSVGFLRNNEVDKAPSSTSREETADAIVKDETPVRRLRGRSHKSGNASEAGDNKLSVNVPKRRGQPSKDSSEESDADDRSYEPSKSEEVVEGDEETDEDPESAAVAWGLITLGGLGSGSAGVFGGEVKAR